MSIMARQPDGYFDEHNQWQPTKFCFVDCGERCTCKPPIHVDNITEYWKLRSNSGYGIIKIMDDKVAKPLDLYTFGNSNAAINLVHILNDAGSEKYTTKVSKFLNDINRKLREMVTFSPEMQKFILVCLTERVHSTKVELPEKIKTHMKNVAIANIRKKKRNE